LKPPTLKLIVVDNASKIDVDKKSGLTLSIPFSIFQRTAL